MSTDPLAVDRLSAVVADVPRPLEPVGEVLPRLDVVQEAWRRCVGHDPRPPLRAGVRHSWTALP